MTLVAKRGAAMANQPWMDQKFAGSAWVTNRDAVYAAQAMRQRQEQEHGYGAIAFSPATGRYGWSYGQPDQATAERAALEQCGAPDASVLARGYDATLALAIAEDGSYGWAEHTQPWQAAKRAFKNCAGPNPRMVVMFNSRSGP